MTPCYGTRVSTTDITVALVTALAVESAAVRLMIDDGRNHAVSRDRNRYLVGWIPSRDSERPHRVVTVLQAQDGTRNAAAVCTDLARSFPDLRLVLMCGIAGGIPAPREPERHVRLGDIVSAAGGIVDYDHVRSTNGRNRLRRPLEGLSKVLLRADRELETREYAGHQPWSDLIAGVGRDVPVAFRRPTGGPATPSPAGGSRVHRAALGSADRLLRDARRRDELARRYGVRAVEMEGSGLAVGADLAGLEWYVVRGVADHCDGAKSDTWHRHAALVAAAYTRILLGEVPPLDADRSTADGPTARPPTTGRVNGSGTAANGAHLATIVDALLALRVMQDDYQRRGVLAVLPPRIRTQVPDHVVARLHVIALVQTCERFPDGAEELLSALRLVLGTESPELARLVAVFDEHWPDR